MHSCETLPVPPAMGPALLLQLGRLIIRSRSPTPNARVHSPADVHDRLLQAKLLVAKALVPNVQPSTSKQFQINNQPRPDPDHSKPIVEAQLSDHVQALWNEQIPICIDVLLAPDCQECFTKVTKLEEEGTFERPPNYDRRCLLLERWTMAVFLKKNHETPAVITTQWLLNAVRSQLHFSQLSAWLARLKHSIQAKAEEEYDPNERRRKLSREQCNIKKLEANCDAKDLPSKEETVAGADRQLNIVYSIKIPGESYKMAEFSRTPNDHTFPITDIGNNLYLKVMLQSLQRREDVPVVKCCCQMPKRRASKDMMMNLNDELALRMHDLTLGPPESRPLDYRGKGAMFSPDLGVINSNIGPSSGVSRRLSIFGSTEYLYSRAPTPERQLECSADNIQGSPNKDGNRHPDRYKGNATESQETTYLVDDRMHTPCSESGKHKCKYDDESDTGNNRKSPSSIKVESKKLLDERRLKEIAKYKRRLRKESKLRKLRESGTSDSATSEGDSLTDGLCNVKRDKSKEETHSSIPILQAARFDRYRAIGCYRNQTYLTLPASRIEIKSPFVPESISVTPTDYRKSISVATQTDEAICSCGSTMAYTCDSCSRRMVRSEANYNLASLNQSELLLKAISKGHGTPGDCKTDNSADAAIKHNCDTLSSNKKCDIFRYSLDSNVRVSDSPVVCGVRKCPDDRTEECNLIKRPKLRRLFPIVDRIEKIVSDRMQTENNAADNSDIEELLLQDDDSVFSYMAKTNDSGMDRDRHEYVGDDLVLQDYGTFGKCNVQLPKASKTGSNVGSVKALETRNGLENQVPSPSERDRFRWRFDSAASMVFHTRTGLPLTSSPAPLKRGSNCFDYDDSINGISGIKSALFHPLSTPEGWISPRSPASPCPSPSPSVPLTSPRSSYQWGQADRTLGRSRRGPSAGLLGSFEESALKGRLEPVATVHGFTAELGASGAFCPPHKKLPVTVFFYAPGGTNAPYMGHINLGAGGYRVSRSGTIQVSLFNPHGTLVKMFVVLYDLTAMPPSAKTFLRQRTLYMPVGVTEPPPPRSSYKWLRYLIHLRFLTSKSGKLYLHTDIRIIVSRKSDLDTATAHSAIFKSLPEKANKNAADPQPTNRSVEPTNRGKVNRMFGGCSDGKYLDYNSESAQLDSDFLCGRRMNRSEGCLQLSDECRKDCDMFELGVENNNDISYELRSFTYGPENPKFSPR